MVTHGLFFSCRSLVSLWLVVLYAASHPARSRPTLRDLQKDRGGAVVM